MVGRVWYRELLSKGAHRNKEYWQPRNVWKKSRRKIMREAMIGLVEVEESSGRKK